MDLTARIGLLMVATLLPACRGELERALPSGAPPELVVEARGCDGGEETACNNLAYAYERGEGVAQDMARAVALYQRACQGGAQLACVNLAELASRGDSAADPVATLTAACNAREVVACLRLGELHADPDGAAPNDVEARRWLQVACDQNLMAGCVGLADLLVAGRGGDADRDQAYHLYSRTCGNNFPDGCARWGEVMLRGPLEHRDAEQAAAHLESACAGDSVGGCTVLARVQRTGESGVLVDVDAAEYHRRRACELGAESFCTLPATAVLLRHAESWKNVEAPPEWTEEQRDALTERGEEQVRAWFPYPATTHLLTSPANRSRQTAATLGAAWSRPEIENEAFAPVDGGTQDDGTPLTWEERTQLLAGGQDVAGQGGRTLREAGESALAALATDAESTTLAVTHGDVIAGVMLATGDATPESVVARIPEAARAIVLQHVGGEWMVLAADAAPVVELPTP